MANPTFKFHIQLQNRQNKPLSTLQVQVWLDQPGPGPDVQLGEVVTDKDGAAELEIKLSKEQVKTPPFAYLVVYDRGQPVLGEQHKSLYKIAGAETTIRLTLEYEGRGRLIDRIPLKRATLRLNLKDAATLPEAQRAFVQSRLNAALLDDIRQRLAEMDQRLAEATAGLVLDYSAFVGKTMGEVWTEVVLPHLQKNAELWKIWEERNVSQSFSGDKRVVSEVLHLEVPLSRNPLFRETVRTIKTVGLTTALGFDDDLADRLAELPLDLGRATEGDWQKLVDDKVISPAEKITLQRGFAFSRFTGGSPNLSAHLEKTLTNIKDMVKFDADDWKQLMEDAGDETPNGETVEEYAGRLLRLAQRSFPSAFFLERKVQRSLPVDSLFEELKKLQPAAARKSGTGVGETGKQTPISLSESPVLQGVANTYRHLDVEKLLTDPATSPAAKMEALQARQGYLKKFTDNNPDLNLRTADFFSKDENGQRKHSMKGIPDGEQAAVRNQMMAFQRVGRLGSTFEVQDALLRGGFDSSHHIVQGNSSQLGNALGGELSGGQIRGLYAAALQQYQQMIQATLAFQSINSTNYFGLSVLDYPEELKNHLQDIDGYSAMFGDQNYCECDHCKSIFGPAAYFVDLMRFVDQQVNLIPNGSNLPLDIATKRDLHPISLKKRRPDLWLLELTCENTNRTVPYLWLINKIKITYLCNVLGIWDDTKSFDKNAELLWAELARLPLGTTAGGSWKKGFRVAFNRPFEESQILLEALGVPYLDILQALEVNQAERQSAAYLGLSEEEWGILTTEDTNFDDLVNDRFGYPATQVDGFDISHWNVKVFQRATSLNREQVETLLGKPVIYTSNTLLSLLSLRAISPGVRLLREVVPNEIQLYHEYIVGLDDAAALDFIHRFLRLWRHLPAWSMRELDMAVQRVAALNPAGVLAITQIYELQQRLNLIFEEAIALHSDIPNEKIYTRQVYNEFLNLSVEEAVPGMLDRLFDQEKINLEDATATVSNMHVDSLTANGQLPYLLRGLGVSQADYERLLGLLFGATIPSLNLKNVSDCYRFVRVAKALGLSVEELSYLLQLDNNSLALDPARILRLLPLVDKVKAMPVSLHEMWFISHSDAGNAGNSTIQSGYIGVNEQNVPLANAAAEQWTKDFFANKALYISKDMLKTYLPAAYQETRVNDFIAALHTAGIVLPAAAESGCRVLRRSTAYLPADIPAQFPNIDPVTNQPIADPAAIVLEPAAQGALAKFLNDNYLFDQDGATSRQTRVIREYLAGLLKMDAGLIENVADWWHPFTGVLSEIDSNWLLTTGLQYTNLQTALPALERVAFVWNKSGFDKADIQWIKTHSAQFLSGANTNGLLSRLDTLDEFVRLSDYMRYKNQAGDDSSIGAYRNALALNKTSWFGAQSEAIARVLGCEPGQLKAVGNLLKIEFTDPNTQQLIYTYDLPASATQALNKLEAILSVCNRLGIYQTDMLLALKECDYPNASHYEKALRDALRARYATEADFEKAWEPYENRINELRRDVLCSFLLALKDLSNFENTGELYAYFLVDVEMSGCARVSEILAATLSLQTYVHRVIMGLEVSVDLDTTDNLNPAVRAFLGHLQSTSNDDNQAEKREQWEWRKNYRVWEANRKVFLYPENWIEPELRDDKSPLFRTLEEELLQQKISLESAEGAYKEYLKGFAEVGNLVIAGAVFNESYENPSHYIFGRTGSDPYIYYYRKMSMIASGTQDVAYDWQPWQKIDLLIASPEITPLIYRNQLYAFWVDIQSEEMTNIEGGGSVFKGTKHKVNLLYSKLNENGKWLQSQRIDFHDYEGKMEDFSNFRYEITHLMVDGELYGNDPYEIKYKSRDYYFKSRLYKKLYVTFDKLDKNTIRVIYNREWLSLHSNPYTQAIVRKLNFSNNKLENGERDWVFDSFLKVLPNQIGGNSTLAQRVSEYRNSPEEEFVIDYYHNKSTSGSKQMDLLDINAAKYKDCILVNRSFNHSETRLSNDLIIKLVDENLLLHKKFIGDHGYRYALIKLNTKVVPNLTEGLFVKGLDGFLSIETQRLNDELIPALEINYTDTEKPPQDRLNFAGAHGIYFRELFFHIPFLIADHLNAEGKYKEADYWYRKILDPSASFENGLLNQTDRYWRFLEFRNQTMPTLKEMLTDRAAISVHENNPFNPHAIARLRLSAYQKRIVMKYVDNLLDWGDSLFRRDTWESDTEAMMLYMLAKDILGDRPEKAGTCESAVEEKNCGCDHPVTYALLKEHEGFGDSPFVYYVENWVDNMTSGGNGTSGDDSGGVIHVVDYDIMSQMDEVDDNAHLRLGRGTDGPTLVLTSHDTLASDVSLSIGFQLYREEGDHLVFCVPHNENMLAYWDRVEDRLFKLRHCMNIDGVKRSLALFQPPIDPALLVNAFAAGLSVDDVLNSLYGDLPAYRFSYLVEKAKSFAGTVQSFGGALLSALEKKDSEALTLLRSTQEQNLLKMTREVKKKAIEEARANLQASVEGMVNTTNRHLHYSTLIEKGSNFWEILQQSSRHMASISESASALFEGLAAINYLFPQLGALTALKFGGKELGDHFSTAATVLKSRASIQNAISTSAGIVAGNKRRDEDWEFQKKTAEQELKQANQQIAAATIRLAIAEKDLEIHEKQIEQATEVHDFYKNKLTGLGLYTYLAKTLNGLHRMAFNTAMDMAKQAEAAYKFETGNDSTAVSGGTFWDASRVGLLSGESLTLELQHLETDFINWNRRQMEIRQSFSMRMIDPEALLALQKDGKCTFTIPEWAFDMQYPGHYRRRIVSVQITIPCVAGPYHNIAATLAMTKGSLRKDSIQDNYTTKPIAAGFAFRGSSMIATSSANNDGGQFDLNFRDERFLPFEGAGAVDSEWVLELPDQFRSFDYETISDVIFQVSYRSKYDGGTFKNAAANSPNGKVLKRLIRLQEEFPDKWYELNQGGATSADIQLTAQHFPVFAHKTGKITALSFGTMAPTAPASLSCVVTITSAGMEDGNLLVSYQI